MIGLTKVVPGLAKKQPTMKGMISHLATEQVGIARAVRILAFLFPTLSVCVLARELCRFTAHRRVRAPSPFPQEYVDMLGDLNITCWLFEDKANLAKQEDIDPNQLVARVILGKSVPCGDVQHHARG